MLQLCARTKGDMRFIMQIRNITEMNAMNAMRDWCGGVQLMMNVECWNEELERGRRWRLNNK